MRTVSLEDIARRCDRVYPFERAEFIYWRPGIGGSTIIRDRNIFGVIGLYTALDERDEFAKRLYHAARSILHDLNEELGLRDVIGEALDGRHAGESPADARARVQAAAKEARQQFRVVDHTPKHEPSA